MKLRIVNKQTGKIVLSAHFNDSFVFEVIRDYWPLDTNEQGKFYALDPEKTKEWTHPKARFIADCKVYDTPTVTYLETPDHSLRIVW